MNLKKVLSNVSGFTRPEHSIIENIETIIECIENIIKLKPGYIILRDALLKEPKYTFMFNEINNKKIDRELRWYSKRIRDLNTLKLSTSAIRKFINRVEKALSLIDLLKSNDKTVSSCVSVLPLRNNNDRLSISMHSIFDSGADVALFGEAGAGKTTTLQAYAKDFSKKNELLLYLPLNRVAKKYINHKLNINDKPLAQSDVTKILSAIILFVGLTPTLKGVDELKQHLKSKGKVIFVLDALDEAVKEIPWILDAINMLRTEFSNSQIIVSSRDCVSYMHNIDFIGVTLLPFTTLQLHSFIKEWIHDPIEADKIICEINKEELFEVAKNPLLATIICSLHKNGIAIPKSESDIYRKKIDLLCDSYDKHKEITRTRTPPDILKKICRQVAFYLHQEGLREASLDQIIKKSILFHHNLTAKLVTQAINELVDPCNVIKRDPITNMHGFGHLRCQ